MRKVALIRTPIIQPSHHVSSLRAVPSIGLAYVKAALSKANFDVSLIDAAGEGLGRSWQIKNSSLTVNGLNADEIVSRIPHDVVAIGVSVMHANEWVYDSIVIQKIHSRFPQTPLFLGGENATGSWQKILTERPEVRAIVLGEGDHIAPELVHALLDQSDLALIHGIAYRNSAGDICQTPRRPPSTTPDAFAWPDWEGTPLDRYFAEKTSISVHNERSLTMLATRGCPHTCSFCTVPEMWNSKWHSRTPADVVTEMKTYVQKYAIQHVDFVDLTFALNRAWTIEFCNLLIQENLPLKWSLPIGTRVEALDFEVLQLLQKAGCVRLLYSPESGSKLTLARIKKKLKIEKMEEVIRDSIRVGLIIKLATIFGFPGQTWRELFGTYLFIFKAALIGVQDVVCLSFIPYPGTELYHELVAEGAFDPATEPVRLNNDIQSMVSWSEQIPSFLMSPICIFGMSLFYGTQFVVRPWRLFGAFKNTFYLRKPQTNFESLLYSTFFKQQKSIGAEDVLRTPVIN